MSKRTHALLRYPRIAVLSGLLINLASACGDDSDVGGVLMNEGDAAGIDGFDAAPQAGAGGGGGQTGIADAAAGNTAVAMDAMAGAPPIDVSDAAGGTGDAAVDAAVLGDAGLLSDAAVATDAGATGEGDSGELDSGGADDGGAGPQHLLITEVMTVATTEFIEIWNPTNNTINLRDYYLSDHQTYFQYPGHVAGNTVLAFDDTDFLVRFPIGATIAAGAVITIATDAVGYETGFTSVPTYTIQELGNSVAMDLLLTGSVPNPAFTNAGEMVALFYWNGVSDRVRDVDIVIAGNAPSAANTLIQKTAVDGPDGDTATTAYATDALTIEDMATDTTGTNSYKRILVEAGHETQAGLGNGITGDDETTEALRTTWDSQAVATNYTAATPGVIPSL